MKILAVYVGVGKVGPANLEHGLKAGIWGFKKKPVGFDTLKSGDVILLATGHTGKGPRWTTEDWPNHSLKRIYCARISQPPFKSIQPEWPGESNVEENKRFVWRVKFDPKTIRTIASVRLTDQSILSAHLAEQIRISGAQNGKGYIVEASDFPGLNGPTVGADVPREMEPPIMPVVAPADLRIAAEAAFNATGFFREAGLVSRFFVALVSKPFVILTGNSGTGKTRLAELFAEWLSGDHKNRYALVPVGADWTDNRNVLGFVNYLRCATLAGETADVPTYQSTKILDLLLAAQAQPAVPFFLILDEMNLSHVERYFSDFLSTLESKDGTLLLHRENRKLPRTPDGPADVPSELGLPRNVFVIGTVNVDETTYMFSPKVLDRANVLEFRVGDDAPEEFLKSGGRPIRNITTAPKGYAESFLKLSYQARCLNGATPLVLFADPAKPPSDAKETLEKCHQTIADLFAFMQQRHQEFAFRSMAEILRFLAVDYELTADNANWDWQAAMDAQILQKILPKLHGSKRKIGSLLAALAKYCEKRGKAEAGKLLNSDTGADAYPATGDKVYADADFKGSHRKLCEMIQSLRRDQFVSFIQ